MTDYYKTYEDWLEHFIEWMHKETQMDRDWCKQYLDGIPLRDAFDRYKANIEFYKNQFLPTTGSRP